MLAAQGPDRAPGAKAAAWLALCCVAIGAQGQSTCSYSVRVARAALAIATL